MTAQTTPEPIIAARGVSRAFDDRLVVNGIDFDVYPGTILGVIGPSGSGKTTTIRMLTGTLARTDGVIRVLGEDPMHFSRDVRGRLAYMPQLFSLYEDLTAEENVGFVAALYGIGPFRRGRLIADALRVVDLIDARGRLARDLSGGMQRRLELACALVHEPEVLFVDEPTSGIDPLLRTAIWKELHRLRNEGRTLLITTQRAVDPELLAGLPGVQAVRQVTARQLVATVEEAATLTPRIVDALRAGGVEVEGIEERQPTFDEVFAALVERRRATRAAEGTSVPDASDAA